MSKIFIGDQDYLLPPKYGYGGHQSPPSHQGCVPYSTSQEIRNLEKEVKEEAEKVKKILEEFKLYFEEQKKALRKLIEEWK
jgi:hypothetical protein